MLPIVLLNYFDTDEFTINGTSFHLYEIGLRLQEAGFDVLFYNPFDNDNVSFQILISKYTNVLPIITDFLTEDHVLLTKQCIFHKLPNYNINRIHTYIHLITDMIEQIMIQYCQRNLLQFILSNRVVWMYDNRLVDSWTDLSDVTVMKQLIKTQKSISYQWGLLSKQHYKMNQKIITQKWLIYSGIVKGLSTPEIVNNAIEYCDSSKLEYNIDVSNVQSPESHYAGLVYAKNKDFSGRLPFEFTMHNKPVKFIGTNKFYRDYLNISLETTQLEIPRLDISNLASYLESV